MGDTLLERNERLVRRKEGHKEIVDVTKTFAVKF